MQQINVAAGKIDKIKPIKPRGGTLEEEVPKESDQQNVPLPAGKKPRVPWG